MRNSQYAGELVRISDSLSFKVYSCSVHIVVILSMIFKYDILAPSPNG